MMSLPPEPFVSNAHCHTLLIAQEAPRPKDSALKSSSSENSNVLRFVQTTVNNSLQTRDVAQSTSSLHGGGVWSSASLVLASTSPKEASEETFLRLKLRGDVQISSAMQAAETRQEAVAHQARTCITVGAAQGISRAPSLMQTINLASTGLANAGAGAAEGFPTPLVSSSRDVYGEGVSNDLDSQVPAPHHDGDRIPPLLFSSRKAQPEKLQGV